MSLSEGCNFVSGWLGKAGASPLILIAYRDSVWWGIVNGGVGLRSSPTPYQPVLSVT